MSRPDGSDRPPLRDIFDELPPEELRRQRRRDEDPDDDVAGPEAPTDVETHAQQGGPGTFEYAGAILDNIVEVGAEQLEKAGEFAESVAGYASNAAEVIGSAANTAWEGATGGDDDGGGEGSEDDGAAGGDTETGGDLTELQSSPTEGIDPGVYVEEVSLHPLSDDSTMPLVETDADPLADDGGLLT